MIGETNQISEKPPRFETIIDLHYYPPQNSGWYRINIVGMGSSAEQAEKVADELYRQAQLAMSVASNHRVHEATESADQTN